uniref:Uncharacterized protein n=1 Tax=Candidatus Kentrum sp. DK TaxID=2126562 RepID=A0A450SFE5_9GAMM|nr:MAG: hypothetical protein BECKDK2373C_GA0170839_103217 [Candidatus Kentron sp. DK]VFJ57348.1 MAG: hypothetical protein BECKDK2373B_GA0170837_106522 [Candidatus Kentron sp. DK]
MAMVRITDSHGSVREISVVRGDALTLQPGDQVEYIGIDSRDLNVTHAGRAEGETLSEIFAAVNDAREAAEQNWSERGNEQTERAQTRTDAVDHSGTGHPFAEEDAFPSLSSEAHYALDEDAFLDRSLSQGAGGHSQAPRISVDWLGESLGENPWKEGRGSNGLDNGPETLPLRLVINTTSLTWDLASDAVTNTITGESITGQAIDGYIVGATVFADANENGTLDAGEAWTTTGVNGIFTLTGGSGPLVLTGGVDISTGKALVGTLSAPTGSTVITPLTTVMQKLIENGTASDANAAQSQVRSAFGLSENILI